MTKARSELEINYGVVSSCPSFDETNMSNQRRVIIIVISVLMGTLLSYLLYKVKRGGQELSSQDVFSLWTNFGFSVAIILGVGFLFLWNKKKNL
jgi:hypothetical protein